jgi:Acetyltransferase (GNAT) domain
MSAQTTLSFQQLLAPVRKPTLRRSMAAAAIATQACITRDPTEPKETKLPAATIFHEPWWLRAASNDGYEEALFTADGRVVGRLPYLRLRKIGWQTALVMPTMTHVLGPSFAADLPAGERGRSLRRFTVCSALISQLPAAGHIWFTLHRQETETLAFEAAGFSTGVRFTVEIAPSDPAILWRDMRDKTRNVIRRAQESLTVQAIDDPELFLEFYEENLRRRGRRNHYDLQASAQLMTACLQRGRGRLLFAADPAGGLQAAIFTAWDKDAEYYLMSTRTPDSGNGAISLLIWTALQEAASEGRIFDMDGIDSRTNHLLLTGFGGTLRPRYVVSRTSATFRIAQSVKSRLNAACGRGG